MASPAKVATRRRHTTAPRNDKHMQTSMPGVNNTYVTDKTLLKLLSDTRYYRCILKTCPW